MVVSLTLYGEQISQYVTFFLRCADTPQDIVAIALEPFFHFGGIGESFRIRCGG
jgi:hypothetical protein